LQDITRVRVQISAEISIKLSDHNNFFKTRLVL